MSELNKTTLKIQHDLIGKLFFSKVMGGNAELHYDRYGDDYLDLISTNVPEPSRGMGIASLMVEEALSFADSQQLGVKPTCPFVADYIKKHPKYQALVRS